MLDEERRRAEGKSLDPTTAKVAPTFLALLFLPHLLQVSGFSTAVEKIQGGQGSGGLYLNPEAGSRGASGPKRSLLGLDLLAKVKREEAAIKEEVRLLILRATKPTLIAGGPETSPGETGPS